MNLPRCCAVVLAVAVAAPALAIEPALSLMPWPAGVTVNGRPQNGHDPTM